MMQTTQLSNLETALEKASTIQALCICLNSDGMAFSGVNPTDVSRVLMLLADEAKDIQTILSLNLDVKLES